MKAFFVRTDSGASGPFTGVELREAALAGLLTPETVISGSASGPWTPAYEAGLFSDKRVPLPHPEGVAVPSFHVNGLSPSFRGPFKLRELVGFAARGLLPPDATLRSESQASWIPVTRVNILAATLRGDLALIDASGKVIRRTVKSVAVEQSNARAPVEIAKPAVQRGIDSAGDSASGQHTTAARLAIQPGSVDSRPALGKPAEQSTVPASLPLPNLNHLRPRFRLPSLSLSHDLLKRVGIAFALVAIVTTAGYAVTQRKSATIAREAVLGDWMVPTDDAETCRCGFALKADGRCVVFNTEAPCWTGRYRWMPRSDDSRGLRGLNTTMKLDTATENHALGPVGATDGYLRFIGEGDSLPTIDGHQVSDAFIQRSGDQLRLGYLVSIDITADRKQLNAAWIVLSKSLLPNEQSDFAALEIDQLPKPDRLLAILGIPDEARPVLRHEVPKEKMSDRYTGAQLIRYGNQRFAMTPTEAWQPVTTYAPTIPMQ
jgi:hypothetical protein